MQIDWTFEACDERDMSRISAYWDRIQGELAGKVAELSDVPSELRIAVERGETDDSWEVRAALHLPGNTVVAESAARTPEKALDQVLRGLALDMDQIEELPAEPALRREGLDEVTALLESCRVKPGRSESFMSFLTPIVASLGPYVERELRVHEYEGALVVGDVTAADILDEVLVAAWEKFPDRNQSLPLDLWLVQLADEALLRLAGTTGQQSLEDESPVPGDGNEDSAWEECASEATNSENRELREILPGGPSADAWDELDLETKQSRLAQMLAGLPRERRQAFVLNLVHGFNTAEIADFQARAVSEVAADIAAATATIQRQFLDERTPDLEEPFIRRELRHFRRKRR